MSDMRGLKEYENSYACQSRRRPIFPLRPRPRPITFSASSGNGRCGAFASSHGARIQVSYSSSTVRITGIVSAGDYAKGHR
jgi:hypothetical protein